MQIHHAEFLGAIAHPSQPLPSRHPQVALAGRSNSGKSSLVNALVGRKRLARVSKRPGKTREINFYVVNDEFVLADLPGYGFARVPEPVWESWGTLAGNYVHENSLLLAVALLIDARRGPLPDDRRMLELLAIERVPALVVLTKIDKLRWSERERAVLQVQAASAAPPAHIFATSARTLEGVSTLLAGLEDLVRSTAEEAR